jgi:hypothetical protein
LLDAVLVPVTELGEPACAVLLAVELKAGAVGLKDNGGGTSVGAAPAEASGGAAVGGAAVPGGAAVGLPSTGM